MWESLLEKHNLKSGRLEEWLGGQALAAEKRDCELFPRLPLPLPAHPDGTENLLVSSLSSYYQYSLADGNCQRQLLVPDDPKGTPR